MMMRSLVAGIQVCTLVAMTPSVVVAQAPPQYGRAYSADEGRQMQSTIKRLSGQYKVAIDTLNAVAAIVGARAGPKRFGEILQLVEQQAAVAAQTSEQMAMLHVEIAKVEQAPIRDVAEDLLSGAKSAFDAGRLDDAAAQLAKLEILRFTQTDEGLTAWAKAVDAQVNIALLRLDHDQAAALLKRQSTTALRLAGAGVGIAWQALVMEAFVLQQKSTMFGGIDGLVAAHRIREVEMAEFIRQYPSQDRTDLHDLLMAESLSSLALRRGTSYAEPNRLLRSYIDRKLNNFDDHAAYALQRFLSNTGSEVFFSRSVKAARPALAYVETIEARPTLAIDADSRFRIFSATSSLYGMMGEVEARPAHFAKAMAYLEKANQFATTDIQKAQFDFDKADIYRQQGQYLNDEASLRNAVVTYHNTIRAYDALRYVLLRDLAYKRLAHTQFVLGARNSDCEMIRQSNANIDKSLAGVSAVDNKVEYDGLMVMRQRNAPLLARFCR